MILFRLSSTCGYFLSSSSDDGWQAVAADGLMVQIQWTELASADKWAPMKIAEELFGDTFSKMRADPELEPIKNAGQRQPAGEA